MKFPAIDPNVGLRYNAGKAPVWKGFIAYFPNAIEAVSRISEFGSNKYAWNNWQLLKNGWENCSESLTRHLLSEAKGQVLDKESNLLEAAHAAWNAMARLEFLIKEQESENTPS